jgi:hypothetical protein
MLGPVTGEPTERVPENTELTVRVDPAIEPTNDAAGLAPKMLAETTVCVEGAATVYVPTPPLPVPSAVTTVPGVTPGAVTGMPTVMAPALMVETTIVVPEMEALNAGATGGTPTVIATEATVWGVFTKYVPVAPVPDPSAVTTVPAAMPGPTRGEPTASDPDCTELTVSVLPEIEPVTEAAGGMPTKLEAGTLCGTDTV